MALARRKARVILACRNMDKAKRAAQEILDSTGQSVVVKQLDLASFKSVNHFCDDILKTGVATRRARQQRWHRHRLQSG
ncbi:retinol dehydrogenase 14-like [Rhipicephalus sanguineus]|uniref:retinol dehydrogenase 14-like n=1 Tax=Rhipicephalus sanguineus TaxID=34632 RepID=UPI0020C2EAD1|nr:retinol dehydrogenase 14-like [Rhipicephalus sanguineus]